MQRYRVIVKWQHRKWGPQTERLAAEGTSVRRALNNALLGFFSDKSNRERRRDAHKGLTVEAWRIKQPRAPRGTNISGARPAAKPRSTNHTRTTTQQQPA